MEYNFMPSGFPRSKERANIVKDFSIRAKFTMLVALFCVIFLVIGVTGLWCIIVFAKASSAISSVCYPSLDKVWTVHASVKTISSAERGLANIKIKDAVERKRMYVAIDKCFEDSEGAIQALETIPEADEFQAKWNGFKEKWKLWRSWNSKSIEVCVEIDKLLELKSPDANAKLDDAADRIAKAFLEERPSYLSLGDSVKDLIATISERTKQEELKIQTAQKRGILLFLLVIALGLLTVVLLGWRISSSINSSLKRIASSLLTGSTQTADASAQVASSSESLAQGASEQASSIEETSASIEEMSSMTKANAENAAKAKDMATSTMKSAEKGSEAMKMMGKAIDDIKKSSDSTAKIVKTIDEIAFQTNLLALNAAVEAARAGESGKGFAVVAEEVRNLAHRSAEAAKNTASLIEESVKNANNGVEISKRTAESLHEIAASAKQVNELLAEIALASEQQAQGISQIGIATSEMEKVTQSNAAGAEEAASASEELSAQAEEMKRIVRDLLALVGGAGVDSDGSSTNPSVRIRSETLSKSHAQKHDFHTQHKGALTDGTAHPTHKPSKRVSSPQEVIPLDDNDFKQF